MLQPDGKIVIWGGFYYFNGQTCGGITRLNSDGSRDDTFISPYTPIGFFEPVRLALLLPDDTIMFGGGPFRILSRLNPDAGSERNRACGKRDHDELQFAALQPGERWN